MYENDDYFNDLQNYSTYQTSYTTEPTVAAKESKKKKSFGKKLGVMAGSALLCGALAGVGFYGVSYAWQLAENKGLVESVEEEVLQQGKLPELNMVTDGDVKVTVTQNPDGSSESVNGNGVVVLESGDVSDMVEQVMPAMVTIINNYVETTAGFFGQTYTQELASSGSGIIVAESDTELLIVSNNHVVSDAVRLDVTFIDGTTAVAQIKGLDPEMDLAVISIPLTDLSQETRDAITIATIGNSDSLKLGQPVIAIGNALGYGQSVTRGIISALDREITSEDGITGTFIQTDAAINPGNSGGALLNMNGEVVGINSSKIGGSVIEGMGYAIPISAASPIISDLMLRETRTKVDEADMGWMGVSLQEVTSQIAAAYNMPKGIYITGVEKNSPAEQCGLMTGDIIVGFDGATIKTVSDLQGTMEYYKAGETIEIEVMRVQRGVYENQTLTITLGNRPQDN